jgi:hypothetical protein
MKTSHEGSVKEPRKTVSMDMITLEGERYLKISNHDAMRPFFMSVVSDSNHWMFISSNGGLTAGRKNKEHALFPYYTDDKITEFADITGSKTIFQVNTDNDIHTWEPFSDRCTEKYSISRNIYKSIYHNKIIFEEINHDLNLMFRYQWNSSHKYGFVKKARLANTSDNDCQITILDGIQNLMPYGVASDLQTSSSNLVDAYKRSELHQASGLGIFALSAFISDRAEPSEALKANIAWSFGLDNPVYLLSSMQLNHFRQKQSIQTEYDVKGEKGAYFVSESSLLKSHSSKQWMIVADVQQTQTQIVSLLKELKTNAGIEKRILDDIDAGTQRLIQLVAAADGLQQTADTKKDTRHFSNTLFNMMRGGIFDDHYQIEKQDFVGYLTKANKHVVARNQEFLRKLDDKFTLFTLTSLFAPVKDADLIRLCIEYLPLKFSRRHGDPSRPWNNFSINTINEKDGSRILDYEGNWRDIFQNWETLAQSYPGFIHGMIFKFLNASTFDGYNPYRITKGGIDWETIEPHNPWSYIGYWGDHQIIYLLKLLEIADKYHPGRLQSYFDKEWFVYASVPYVIKPYDQILKDPKDTIEFDSGWDARVRKERQLLGADGTLLKLHGEHIYHVNFIEKILATVLAKIANFIPETGIWMNTQRPEWNDANNALVGNGVSMVTLYYMHRFMKFFQRILKDSGAENVRVSGEMVIFFNRIRETLKEYKPSLADRIDSMKKKIILDHLGQASSAFRHQIYTKGFSGNKGDVSLAELQTFTNECLDFIEHTIRANKRDDKLFHAYNLVTVSEKDVSSSNLSEMLEGQVAVLSSGFLTTTEALELLDALKGSSLFRKDQYSYILYPNKELPGFLQKNNIPADAAQSSELIIKLIADGNKDIVDQDIEGNIHFNGNFRNVKDLKKSLQALAAGKYEELVEKEQKTLPDLFEDVFNHKAFTGRSGTFYAYEGLGSIYWHMVSKLLLALQECCLKAMDEKADPAIIGRLLEHYYEIEAGIGVHKSPELYGAFPTDPYSHTPMHRGAQQPGMTGQVKEDILVRFAELGLSVHNGQLTFHPTLLRREEFLTESKAFEYLTVDNEKKQILLEANQLGFTYCQIPVVYTHSDHDKITIFYSNGITEEIAGKTLNQKISSLIFSRTGNIERMEVCFSLR